MSTAAPSPRSTSARAARQPDTKRLKREGAPAVTGGQGTSQVTGELSLEHQALWDAVPYIRRTGAKNKWKADPYKKTAPAHLGGCRCWDDPRLAFAAHLTGMAAVSSHLLDQYIDMLAAPKTSSVKTQKRRVAIKAVVPHLKAWDRKAEFSAVTRVVKAVTDNCEAWFTDAELEIACGGCTGELLPLITSAQASLKHIAARLDSVTATIHSLAACKACTCKKGTVTGIALSTTETV